MWRPLSAHAAIHRAVKGEANAASSADDQAAMQRPAEEAFDDGAIGLSTGLAYWPGNTAPQSEIAALVVVAAQRGGLYATHVRNRDVYDDLGFSEAIATARHAGARLQISHIQPKYGAPTQAMQHTLEMIYRARREGVDLTFDIIPHDWNPTVMVSALPAWAREDSSAKTLERSRNPALRERMQHNPEPIWRLVDARRWQDIVLLHSLANADSVGLSLEEIGRRRGIDAHDAVLDLLLEEGPALEQVMWTSRGFSDADVCMSLREADYLVMSDTLALTGRGPLQGMIGSLSGYGWTSRLLGHCVRERSVLSQADAVSRITSQPAERLGLADRGRLRPGAWADIVVFDPATVQDRSSFLMPRQHPAGINYVLVNGVVAVENGQRNDAQPGQVLRG